MVMFGSPDFWLECSDPILVRGLFGIERRVKFVDLGLDDPDEFRREIESRIVVDVPLDAHGSGNLAENDPQRR